MKTLLAPFALALFLASPSSAEVHYIGAGGSSSSGLGVLQDTINQAADGDVIVLQQCWNPFPDPCWEEIAPGEFVARRTYDTPRVGSYAGIPANGTLVIDNKSLTIVGSFTGNQTRPIIGGPILVLGDSTVFFRGLTLWGAPGVPQPSDISIDPHNVRAVDATAQLYFEDCLISRGAPTAVINNSDFEYEARANIELVGGACELVLTRCMVTGKPGASWPFSLPKQGIAADTGSHRIAIYDSLVSGGAGSNLPFSDPDGVPAITLGPTSELHAGGSTVRGGTGYLLDATLGGDGVIVDGNATLQWLDSAIEGGVGGWLGGTGGQPVSGPGQVTQLEGAYLSCTVDAEGTGLLRPEDPVVIAHLDTSPTPPAQQAVIQSIGAALDSLSPGASATGWVHVLDPLAQSVHVAVDGQLTTDDPAPRVFVEEPLVFFTQSVFGSDGSEYVLSTPSMGVVIHRDVKIFTPLF